MSGGGSFSSDQTTLTMAVIGADTLARAGRARITSIQAKGIASSKLELHDAATAGAAGADLYSTEDCVIPPGLFKCIGIGLAFGIEEGYEVQIRPRSGMAAKFGVTVLNSPGTIDCDYTNEVKVILVNHSSKNYHVNIGDRIAQMVVAKVTKPEFISVYKLTPTARGGGGFGHTGK